MAYLLNLNIVYAKPVNSIPGYISDLHKKMFVAVLFIIVSRQKQPKCPSRVGHINAWWYIHRMEFRTRENKLNTTTHDFDESHKYVK